jgi:hypothetical protein
MEQKHGIIYLWFDSKKKRYYLGAHWGTDNDGYICSSRWMKSSYKRRPECFKRRILEKNIETKEQMFMKEERWLSLIKDEELGKKYYNLQKHWKHWNGDLRKSLSVRQKLSETSKKLHQDPAYKEKYLEGRKKLPPRSEEAIRKTALANTGKKRTEETKKKISDAHKGKVMGPLSEETKQKLSVALSGKNNPFYGKQHDPEKKQEMSRKTSVTMKGRMPKNIPSGFWWNNGSINKRSNENPGSEWTRGKIKKV